MIGATCAQTDAIPRTPYDVHIVILPSDHRFLSSELFQEQFPRDVAVRTKRALGLMARVEVASSHPLAEAIRREGLDAAVDGHQEVSNRRTWFLAVRFHEGQFHLQGRFFDGLTGMTGPASVTAVTSDRARLAKLAADMIVEGFPLVGQVRSVKGDRVQLALFGGAIGDVRVPVGSVFTIARIQAEADSRRSHRVPWAVLQTVESATNGLVTCQFHRRFAEDSLGEAGDVYRALALPVRTLPLRLRVFDKETSQPLGGLGVTVGGAAKSIELVTDAAGVATTPGNVSRLALVKLTQGGASLAQFPVPILDDRTVNVEISTKAEAEVLAGLDVRRRQFVVRAIESLQFVDRQIAELRVLLGQSLERSQDHAARTLAVLDSEIKDLGVERLELASKLKAIGNKTGLVEGEKGIARLQQLRGVIVGVQGDIALAMKDREARSEKRQAAAKLFAQAELLASQAKFDEALRLYREGLELAPEQAKIREKYDDLRKGWAIANAGHERARRFFVDVWPNLEIEGLKDHAIVAKKALEVCRDAGDSLSPRCFLQANVDHLAKIGRMMETLSKSRSADDRQRLAVWNETLTELRRLSNEAVEATKGK